MDSKPTETADNVEEQSSDTELLEPLPVLNPERTRRFMYQVTVNEVGEIEKMEKIMLEGYFDDYESADEASVSEEAQEDAQAPEMSKEPKKTRTCTIL